MTIDPLIESSAGVTSINKGIITIRKHIVTQESLTSTRVAVRIDEPPIHRVIVSALQIVKSRFDIVVVAPVTDGVADEDGLGISDGGIDCVGGPNGVADSAVLQAI